MVHVSRMIQCVTAVAFLFAAGCGSPDAANSDQAQQMAEKQRLTKINLDYWNQLNMVKKRLPGEFYKLYSDALQIGNESAKEIEEIPIKDVDHDLVELANSTAGLCRRWGQYLEDHFTAEEVGWRLLRGIGQGLTFDYTSAAKEDAEVSRGAHNLIDELNTLRQRALQLRLDLSTRYHVEFSPLDLSSSFPD